jgi:hypothetical protein
VGQAFPWSWWNEGTPRSTRKEPIMVPAPERAEAAEELNRQSSPICHQPADDGPLRPDASRRIPRNMVSPSLRRSLLEPDRKV